SGARARTGAARSASDRGRAGGGTPSRGSSERGTGAAAGVGCSRAGRRRYRARFRCHAPRHAPGRVLHRRGNAGGRAGRGRSHRAAAAGSLAPSHWWNMTEDKLHIAIARGARAEALLGNELLQEAFVRLEQDYIDAWKISPARDTDGRERLWQAVNIVAKVRDHIVKVVNDGKLAQRHLNELVRSTRKRA